jgi:hypothetical protein
MRTQSGIGLTRVADPGIAVSTADSMSEAGAVRGDSMPMNLDPAVAASLLRIVDPMLAGLDERVSRPSEPLAITEF